MQVIENFGFSEFLLLLAIVAVIVVVTARINHWLMTSRRFREWTAGSISGLAGTGLAIVGLFVLVLS